jgi:hypothetical protein
MDQDQMIAMNYKQKKSKADQGTDFDIFTFGEKIEYVALLMVDAGLTA